MLTATSVFGSLFPLRQVQSVNLYLAGLGASPALPVIR